LFWEFTAIDPATGLPPLDPAIGFLPPNTDGRQGQGFATYTVRALQGTPSGTVVDAEARIVFDTNAPIDTPRVFNTLDGGIPVSSVTEAVATATAGVYRVSWTGQDEPEGSGLAGFDLYVSRDGGPFEVWLANTTLQTSLFVGDAEATYAFYSVAIDRTGNREPAPLAPDTATAPLLAPIPNQAMFGDEVLTLPLVVTGGGVPASDLIYTATADDYGYLLDQTLNFARYWPEFDNFGGLGDKWLTDSAGEWYFIHVDAGAGLARLRRWQEDPNLADDLLVADLHRAYHDQPLARLVHPVSSAFTPATTAVPAQVTVDPPNAFVGTLRVSVTVSDGSDSDSKSFSVQVAPSIDLAPIANQAMHNDGALQLALSATDHNTPLDSLTYAAAADDYGYVLDQMLNLVSYHPNFDNYYGAGEKWLRDVSGNWFIILPGGAGQAFLRRWDGGSIIADDTLVAQLHRVYYDEPAGRLVNPVSIAFTPATSTVPAQVTIDPPNAFLGTLWANVTVSDGVNTDSEAFRVEVTQGIDLAPIPNQIMFNNQVRTVPLAATDPDTPPAGLSFTATADDYGFVLDQMLNLASYQPHFDNYYGAGDKWLVDASGVWYLIHLDGANQAFLRRWDGGSNVTDDTLVAELHRVYYDDVATRLVTPVSIAFTPATSSIPAQVTIDPADTFVGTLRVNVTVSDGPHSASESFSVHVNASGDGVSAAEAFLAGQGRPSEKAQTSKPRPAEADLAMEGAGEPSSARRDHVQAVDVAFEDILGLLSEEDPQAALADIADRVELPLHEGSDK
jgi:hypothetical protein